jgi:chromosome segregation ATPase
MLSVSSRVRSLETQTTELNKKLLECETSCQGVSNLFDEVEEQTKSNTRNIIHHDSRIKKLETFEKQPAQNQDQHIDEINRLKDSILDRRHVPLQ